VTERDITILEIRYMIGLSKGNLIYLISVKIAGSKTPPNLADQPTDQTGGQGCLPRPDVVCLCGFGLSLLPPL